MPKLDVGRIVPEPEGEMPPEFLEAARGRVIRFLSKAGGIGDFVATHVVVPPGGWSSQRHWHEGEDELAVILSGQAILVDEDGRHPMTAGEVAVFPKGDGNGHHLRNESDAPLTILAVSLAEHSPVHYPDVGKRWSPGEGVRDER
jgi:uncharacterized cupin superfamily protein